MVSPGVQLIQNGGILVAVNQNSKRKEFAVSYLNHLFSPKAQQTLLEDLGLLSPLENSNLPYDKYPILEAIEKAMTKTSPDPELYIPAISITDLQYRLDDLFVNTQEITVDQYISKMVDILQLY